MLPTRTRLGDIWEATAVPAVGDSRWFKVLISLGFKLPVISVTDNHYRVGRENMTVNQAALVS